MAKASTAILAACGEHYVAAYLSRFQLIVALPRAGVPGVDLLVASQKGGRAIRVQVADGDAEFFWMKREDAGKYKGESGLLSILKSLGQIPTST